MKLLTPILALWLLFTIVVAHKVSTEIKYELNRVVEQMR